MMADKGRKEDVARTRGDKDKLVALAKAWFLPFLSEVQDILIRIYACHTVTSAATAAAYGGLLFLFHVFF